MNTVGQNSSVPVAQITAAAAQATVPSQLPKTSKQAQDPIQAVTPNTNTGGRMMLIQLPVV